MSPRQRTVSALLLAGITVLATFGVAGAAEPGTQGYFTDDNGHLFEQDIDAIAAAGITKGCNPPSNTRFCPDLNVDRGAMAAFLRRALHLPPASRDHFSDDNRSIFESDINAIAEAGITRGCNPPENTRYCPNDVVSREAMAAFLRRALHLPSGSRDYFTDDNRSIFQADINAIAEAGITKGCNPPANTLYCPREAVSRGAMAAFLRRALELPRVLLQLLLSDHSSASCTKDGTHCSFTLIVSPGRSYRVQEGLFQVLPATSQENSQFNAAGTSFTLTANGEVISMTSLPAETRGGISYREWRRDMSFSAGTHTLVARWRWNGELVLTNIVTVRSSG
ncbi:MAG: hypothetical protein ACRDVL_13510 [Acidimicrobiia bacterium]